MYLRRRGGFQTIEAKWPGHGSLLKVGDITALQRQLYLNMWEESCTDRLITHTVTIAICETIILAEEVKPISLSIRVISVLHLPINYEGKNHVCV